MRLLSLALPAALTAAAVAAPAAQAAEIHTDRPCYLQTAKTTVTVTGSGFPAGQPYTVAVDGLPLAGTSVIGADGGLSGAFNPPALEDQENQRRFPLGVTSMGVQATTQFTVTRFKAFFRPTRGSVERLRVRFSVFGFGLTEPGRTIYLHYVSPHHELRKTVRLGKGRGQCGALPRTAKRRLFPFSHPQHGKWALQLDTHPTYHRGVRSSKFLFYTLFVRVRSA